MGGLHRLHLEYAYDSSPSESPVSTTSGDFPNKLLELLKFSIMDPGPDVLPSKNIEPKNHNETMKYS